MSTPPLKFIFDFDAPPADPVAAIQSWLQEAVDRAATPNPNAIMLATADAHGKPSVRPMLLKGLDEHGAVFFTNRSSRKGRELEYTKRAALLLFWDDVARQIRIEGTVTQTTPEEDDAYFSTRPRQSQLSAFASDQSSALDSRAHLERLIATVRDRYEGKPIPRPPHWGGYRLTLDSVEFWEGEPSRLHDRVLYTRTSDGWSTVRLAP